jgi:RND family efflux transporter MFP subunit
MRTALPLVAATALLLSACGNGDKPVEPIRPVLTVTVAPSAAGTGDVYSGEVRARVETDLAFRVGGKVTARLVDAGSRVKAGQPLARLDPEDARLAADAARAQLASAEADFALARSELDRASDLLARKFISQSAFDSRQTAFSAAKARVDQVRSQATLSANQQSYTTLAADADGVVLTTSAEPGQVVAAGQAVLRLARDGEKEVVINAPESQVARFRAGQAVAISLWAQPASVVPGVVREVAGGADPVTRTFVVRVSVPRAPDAMRVGMTASVALAPATPEKLIVVPLTALTRQGEEQAVWVVDAKTSKVRRRAVKVGQFREDGATIESGLAPGEIIVAVGAHKLLPDQQVRLVGDTQAPASAR